MSWNECLYAYHKKYGGRFLAGEEDDGLLALTWKDRPLVADQGMEPGRYGPLFHPRARLPVTLAKPYKLTIGAEKALSGGVNAVLKVTSAVGESMELVLGSLDLRSALLACPRDRVEVRPGPGEEGLHLITVSTEAALNAGLEDDNGWYLGTNGSYTEIYGSEEEKAKQARRVEEEFFPRLDRFLDLARAACNAVTQWPM